jgi:signal transduction histidine kinase
MKTLRRGSLKSRLILALVAGYLIWTVGFTVVSGLGSFAVGEGWRGPARTLGYAVSDSVHFEAGRLAVTPTANLVGMRNAHPSVWWAVTDGRNVVTAGPVPMDVSGLAAGKSLFDEAREIHLIADANTFAARGAAIERVSVGDRAVLILAGGLPPTVCCGFDSLIVGGVLAFLFTLIIFAVPIIAVVWWVMWREARAFAALGRDTAQIGPANPAARIATDGLPREFRPLALGVNAALDRLEEGLARERLFAAAAAHELRTPLAVLIAHLDSLPQGRIRRQLEQDARTLTRLVNELLAFARIVTRRDPLESVDYIEIIARAIRDCEGEAVARTITIQASFPEAFKVAGSVPALRTMVANILRNAIAASPEGSVISVRLTNGPVLYVTDTGPGIPETEREAVFEPFRRARNSTGDGAGLGLALVREVATAHGWIAEIRNNPHGTGVVAVVGDLSRSVS